MNGWKAFISVFGIGVGMIAIGAFFTIFIIGAIIGLPLILAGVVCVLASPFAKFYMIEGKCPYCEKVLQAATFKNGIKCVDCKKRIILRDRKFIAV